MSNTTKFSISNQEEFESCLLWASDAYKDVYGHRPGYSFHTWSFQELSDFINDIIEEEERQEDMERAYAEKAIADVMSVGADSVETALRWLDQADAHFIWGDDEFAVEDMSKYGWVAKKHQFC